jgi:NO-binding membrane sensor protein with MHYT domain
MTPETLTPSYDLWLVIASFLVSTAGAYTALWVASSMLNNRQRVASKLNIFLAGLALGGVGIWSMHFLGMIAYEVPLTVGYRPLETLVSLLAAVAASSVALGYIAAEKFAWKRLFVAGPLAGLGVAGMHYLGMYGMSFGGFFDWSWELVALSVVIAMVAATVALWLAFHTHQRSHRIGAALLMGAAVCTMHYTGMAAASVVCTTPDRFALVSGGLLRPRDLSFYVILVAISIATMIVLDVMMQRLQHRAQAAR